MSIIKSPATQAAKPPKGNRGTAPGTYNGEKGYPGRTSSPNAPPEKTRDSCGGKY